MARVNRLLVSCLALATSATFAFAGETTQKVKFARGATSSVVKGAVKGYDGANYTIEAAAGQTLKASLKASNDSCYFNVYEPGKSDAVHDGSANGDAFNRAPTIAGVYRTQVYLMRNAARRNETCRFSLSIEITGG